MVDPSDTPGYAEAMTELEGILAELERTDLDVDRLSALVSRASDLVKSCRARITTAQIDVQRVIDGILPDIDD